MKKMLALLLALLLCLGTALAESEADFLAGFEDDAEADAFAYNFDDDDSYEGEWVQIPAINAQFCLPDGWTEQPVAEDVLYTADKDDGTARLFVYLEAEGVEDIETWVQQKSGDGAGYALEPAGQYTAAVREEAQNGSLFIDVRTDGGKVVLFSFARTSEDALTRDLALGIAGTLYEDIFAEADFLAGGEEIPEEAQEATQEATQEAGD